MPYRARHDRDLGTGLVNVKEALGLIKRRYEFLEQTFGALAAFRLDDSTLMQYLVKVFPDPSDVDDECGWERVDAWRCWASHLFRTGRGNQATGITGSLWAASQAPSRSWLTTAADG